MQKRSTSPGGHILGRSLILKLHPTIKLSVRGNPTRLFLTQILPSLKLSRFNEMKIYLKW